MSKVKEKSTDRASIRKDIRKRLSLRNTLVEEISEQQSLLERLNESLYDRYEKLGIQVIPYKGEKYRVQQSDLSSWMIPSLKKFLRNKFGKKAVNKIIYTKTVETEKVDDGEMQKLINSMSSKKEKEKLNDQLTKLVNEKKGKKFIRIYN